MTQTPEHNESQPCQPQSRCAATHPAWCDATRCTADPASQVNGFRPDLGGEHRSAPIPLDLTAAHWLPVRDGTVWLSEACAPWPCGAFLRVRVGETQLDMAVECALPLLDALSALLASARTAEEATR